MLPALAATPDPFMGSPFNQNQLLAYRWGSGAVPTTAIKTAINAAADDSNASRKSKAPTFAYDAGGSNSISYGVDVPCGVNGLACFRRDAPDWFAVYLRENGHRFDWGTLRWCEATDRPNGCYDAENITLDELGHVLGLDHHVNLPDDSDYGDAVVQTYSRAKPRAFYNAHVFGRCDIATLQQVYDVTTSSTSYSTCLDVPTRRHDDGDADLGRGRVGGDVHRDAGQRRDREAVEQRHQRAHGRPAAADGVGLDRRPHDGPGVDRGHLLRGARDALDIGPPGAVPQAVIRGPAWLVVGSHHRDRQRGVHHGVVSPVRPRARPVSTRHHQEVDPCRRSPSPCPASFGGAGPPRALACS